MRSVELSLNTYKAIEAHRLSFEESHDEIIRRVCIKASSLQAAQQRAALRSGATGQRRRGNLSLDMLGERQPQANLKSAYLAALRGLLRYKHNLFELLSLEGTSRRKWVAKSPEALFQRSPHLAARHAEKILPNWFVDTNLSKDQILRRIKRAAALAGVRYGHEIKLLDNRVAL